MYWEPTIPMMSLGCNLETNFLVLNKYYSLSLYTFAGDAPILFPLSTPGQHSFLELVQSQILCSYFQMILPYRYLRHQPQNAEYLQSISLIACIMFIIYYYYVIISLLNFSHITAFHLHCKLSEGKKHFIWLLHYTFNRVTTQIISKNNSFTAESAHLSFCR